MFRITFGEGEIWTVLHVLEYDRTDTSWYVIASNGRGEIITEWILDIEDWIG